MKCPVDDEPLNMSERNGVEIDYCPKCRGVWLDRGELDKIIDRASPDTAGAEVRPATRQDSDRRGERPYRKKKDSFLSDLFDF